MRTPVRADACNVTQGVVERRRFNARRVVASTVLRLTLCALAWCLPAVRAEALPLASPCPVIATARAHCAAASSSVAGMIAEASLRQVSADRSPLISPSLVGFDPPPLLARSVERSIQFTLSRGSARLVAVAENDPFAMAPGLLVGDMPSGAALARARTSVDPLLLILMVSGLAGLGAISRRRRLIPLQLLSLQAPWSRHREVIAFTRVSLCVCPRSSHSTPLRI